MVRARLIALLVLLLVLAAATWALLAYAARSGGPPPFPITIQAQRAVVRIEASDASGVINEGSGVAFEPDQVMTALHVLEGAVRARVQLADGSFRDVVGVSGWSVESDLAVLRIEGSIEHTLDYSEFMPSPGERLTVVPSNYLYQPPPPSLVVWTGVDPEYGLSIVIDQVLSPGMSGSPLVDEQGVFRGIAIVSDLKNWSSVSANLDEALPYEPEPEPVPLDEFTGASEPRMLARALAYEAHVLLEAGAPGAIEAAEEALALAPDAYAVLSVGAEVMVVHDQLDRADELLSRIRVMAFDSSELYLESLVWAKRNRPEMFDELRLRARLIASSPDRRRARICLLILAGREAQAHQSLGGMIQRLEHIDEPVPQWMRDVHSQDADLVLESILRFARERAEALSP